MLPTCCLDRILYLTLHITGNFSWVRAVLQLPQSGSRDGAVVRALASHQCGPGSIPGPGVICGLSLLLVLVPAPRVFLRVLRFSSLHKNQHFQIPIRSAIRGPQVCQSQDCYVLPSLNKVFIIIMVLDYLQNVKYYVEQNSLLLFIYLCTKWLKAASTCAIQWSTVNKLIIGTERSLAMHMTMSLKLIYRLLYLLKTCIRSGE